VRYLGLTCCVLVLAAIVASPASAAFPGRDGLLAVQPLSGSGLLLVNAHGGAQRRICTNRSRCGSPRNPRWSPDGRVLAFQASTVHLIYPDGSCLNCQMGGAGTPAFTANPELVTFESGGALLEDAIDGIRKATVLEGTASDAVWSAGGQLALVRAGQVWAGIPHHLRRLGAGSSPSWSPSGAQIAIARKGWVVVVGLRRHSARRLVRGSTPAWSPDGRSIAFIGAGHDLRIVAASGGRARWVARVRGDAVDWQPLPSTPVAACAAPPGSTVIASSATAVVTGDSNPGNDAYMGCLRADGRERLLESFSNGEDDDTDVPMAAVGGGYAAIDNYYTDPHYGGSQATVAVFDLQTGAAVADRGGETVICSEDSSVCIAGISQLVVGSGGVSAADLTSALPPGSLTSPLAEISCPSSSFCAAVDGAGRVLTSIDPSGGGPDWTITPSSPFLTDVSCPSPSFCAGVGGTFIFTSTDPAGGAGTWTPTMVDTGTGSGILESISCPSASLCIADDDAGNVFTSTDPAGGAGTWTRANVDGTKGLGSITCPSPSLCVTIDSSGDAISSSEPTAGAGAWQTATVSGSPPQPASVSCPSTTLCVAVKGAPGEAFTSTDPTSGAPWASVVIPGIPEAVSCPSISLCLAVGQAGTLDVSTDPAAGAWTSTEIDGGQQLRSIDCASSSLCVAGDAVGNVVISSNPTGGPAAWTPALVDGNPCSAQTWCTTEDIVASDGTGVHMLDTITAPGMGSMLTGLTLTGSTLAWGHAGTPESATLAP